MTSTKKNQIFGKNGIVPPFKWGNIVIGIVRMEYIWVRKLWCPSCIYSYLWLWWSDLYCTLSAPPLPPPPPQLVMLIWGLGHCSTARKKQCLSWDLVVTYPRVEWIWVSSGDPYSCIQCQSREHSNSLSCDLRNDRNYLWWSLLWPVKVFSDLPPLCTVMLVGVSHTPW